MLNLDEWLKLIKEWVHQGQWEKIKISARKRRQAREKLFPVTKLK